MNQSKFVRAQFYKFLLCFAVLIYYASARRVGRIIKWAAVSVCPFTHPQYLPNGLRPTNVKLGTQTEHELDQHQQQRRDLKGQGRKVM